jgi:hypothetical protein
VTFLAFVPESRYFESSLQDQNFALNLGTKTMRDLELCSVGVVASHRRFNYILTNEIHVKSPENWKATER